MSSSLGPNRLFLGYKCVAIVLLCRTISNTVIPIIPQFHLLQPALKPAQETHERNLVDGKPSVPIELKFYEWLDALLIAIKYKKELKPTDKSGRKSEDMFTLMTNETDQAVPRFYTCPLDQVKEFPFSMKSIWFDI